jgi:hypothetical protein
MTHHIRDITGIIISFGATPAGKALHASIIVTRTPSRESVQAFNGVAAEIPLDVTGMTGEELEAAVERLKALICSANRIE